MRCRGCLEPMEPTGQKIAGLKVYRCAPCQIVMSEALTSGWRERAMEHSEECPDCGDSDLEFEDFDSDGDPIYSCEECGYSIYKPAESFEQWG